MNGISSPHFHIEVPFYMLWPSMAVTPPDGQSEVRQSAKQEEREYAHQSFYRHVICNDSDHHCVRSGRRLRLGLGFIRIVDFFNIRPG